MSLGHATPPPKKGFFFFLVLTMFLHSTLFLVETEDEQLQRVLEESRRMHAANETPAGVSQEDLQIQKVVEASLLEAGGDTTTLAAISNNPNFRKREEGMCVFH